MSSGSFLTVTLKDRGWIPWGKATVLIDTATEQVFASSRLLVFREQWMLAPDLIPELIYSLIL